MKARYRAIRAIRDPRKRREAEVAASEVRSTLHENQVSEPAVATRTLAKVMDTVFKVPGTDFRFGVDPLLSIFPAVGSTVGAAFGAVILFDAVRLRTPVPVLLRMIFNQLVNWVVGMVPGIGPVFDAFFKSNARNMQLLDRTIKDREQVRRRTLWYWAAVAVAMVAMVILVIGGFILVVNWLDSVLFPK